MSSSAAFLDAIARARNNAALLLPKKIRFRQLKEAHSNAKSGNSLFDNDVKLTDEEWKIYKRNLKIKLKQQQKKEIFFIVLLLVILLIVGGFISLLLFFI